MACTVKQQALPCRVRANLLSEHLSIGLHFKGNHQLASYIAAKR